MEFEMEAQKMKAQLKSKHEEEFNQFVQELEDSIPANPKDSAEVLSLRKQEEQLAKQEQYSLSSNPGISKPTTFNRKSNPSCQTSSRSGISSAAARSKTSSNS